MVTRRSIASWIAFVTGESQPSSWPALTRTREWIAAVQWRRMSELQATANQSRTTRQRSTANTITFVGNRVKASSVIFLLGQKLGYFASFFRGRLGRSAAAFASALRTFEFGASCPRRDLHPSTLTIQARPLNLKPSSFPSRIRSRIRPSVQPAISQASSTEHHLPSGVIVAIPCNVPTSVNESNCPTRPTLATGPIGVSV